MKIYFSGDECNGFKITKKLNLKILSNYYYLRNRNNTTNENVLPKNLFLDSGGFSAFTKGVEININDYIDFIYKYKSYIAVYAQLDTIGDSNKTEEQLKYMESNGLNPLPVFHIGSDYSVLKKLCNKYEYIALGGLVPLARQKNKLFNHLDKCFSIVRDKVKTHGFGMNGLELLKRYPFYSVDATSWLRGSIGGDIYTFENGILKNSYYKDKSPKYFSNITYNDRDITNCKAFLQMEKFVNDLWIKKGITWSD